MQLRCEGVVRWEGVGVVEDVCAAGARSGQVEDMGGLARKGEREQQAPKRGGADAPIRRATTLLPSSHTILLSSTLPTTLTHSPSSTTTPSLWSAARRSRCANWAAASALRGETARAEEQEVVGLERGRRSGRCACGEVMPRRVVVEEEDEASVAEGQTTSRTAVPSSTGGCHPSEQRQERLGVTDTQGQERKSEEEQTHRHTPMRCRALSTRGRRPTRSRRPRGRATRARRGSTLGLRLRRRGGGARAGTRRPRRRGGG